MIKDEFLKRKWGHMIAYITWKINRFGYKQHNNEKYNRDYFEQNKERIEKIEKFLEDDLSKEIYRQCLIYRATHLVREQPLYNRRDQYFPKDIIGLTDSEIFIDCGAYTGDTIRKFKRGVNNKYKKIVAFEPSEKNLKNLKKIKDITIIKAGVWDEETTLYLKEDGEGSVIVKNQQEKGRKNNEILCKRIDDCTECRQATYIKMDIEGAELKALKGAEKTITENTPKLAICIYHTAEDMVMIPLYIHDKYPQYKLYVRHHSHRCSETVLYAIPSL